MVKTQKLNFMVFNARLFLKNNRTADGLTIITHGVGIDLNKNKRKRQQYNVLKHLINENNGCVFYSKKLSLLNFVIFDNEIFVTINLLVTPIIINRGMVLRRGIRNLVQMKLVSNLNQLILRTAMLRMKIIIILTPTIVNNESWILLPR